MSEWRKQCASKQCASKQRERANRGTISPVLYASILQSFDPLCVVANTAPADAADAAAFSANAVDADADSGFGQWTFYVHGK